jgi:hypothetical protein
LADALETVARRIGAPPPDVLTAVFAHWAELVGIDIAAHATPRLLRGGVLTVVVDHPAWATQLRFLSATLVDQLGRRTGAPDEIASIRIQVGDPTRAGGAAAGEDDGDVAGPGGVPRRRTWSRSSGSRAYPRRRG